MKRFILLFLVVLFFLPAVSWGQIFSQNFNYSTTLADYYNSSPSTNQFRIIDVSGAGATISVATNSLVMTRNTGNNAYAERNVDFSTVPSGMKFQFDLTVSGGGAASSAILVAVGTSVNNASTVPTLTSTFARLAINTTSNSGEFKINDITNTTVGTNTYTGTNTISWYLNNTGSTQTYNSPSNSSETIANGKADIWVGTTKEFDDILVQTNSQTLARFKFYTVNWVNGTVFTIDNIAINNESALPVQLTSFTASNVNNGVQLNWQTATEVNNYGFEVERQPIPNPSQREGNSSWTKIGFVNGHGNSNSSKSYSFLDNLLLAHDLNRLQYRLKQIDFDGKFEYSNIVEVNVEVPAAFVLHQNSPNPFNPTTEIKFSLPKNSNVELSVYNLLGEIVQRLANAMMNAGEHKVMFDASNLSSGVYIYKLTTDNYFSTRKMVLLK